MSQARKPVRMLAALGLVVVVVLIGTLMANPRQGYAPKQPIPFRHDRMAAAPDWRTDADGNEVNFGGHGIPCLYCHTMPFEGRHSTLPSTDICMNCHSTVGQNKEWVLVLKEYWDRGEPIPWVKVHDLPDFVYYDHSVHLNALDANGRPKLAPPEGPYGVEDLCANCHGDVKNDEVVEVRKPLNMSWCLDCHRKPEMAAPTDCVTCHR